MMPAPFLGLKVQMSSAAPQTRIWSATSRPFCLEAGAAQNRRNFIIGSLFLRLPARDVALEGARQRNSPTCPHHVLSHEDRHMLATVMDGDSQLMKSGRTMEQRDQVADRTLVVQIAHRFDLLQQVAIDEQAFFELNVPYLYLNQRA